MNPREDFDPALVGRRVADGDYISFREAVKMFATKEELSSMHTALQMVVQRVDSLPQRDEMSVRWQRDDEYKVRFEDGLKEIKAAVEELKADRPPKWLIPVLAIVAPIIFGTLLLLVQHFWH